MAAVTSLNNGPGAGPVQFLDSTTEFLKVLYDFKLTISKVQAFLQNFSLSEKDRILNNVGQNPREKQFHVFPLEFIYRFALILDDKMHLKAAENIFDRRDMVRCELMEYLISQGAHIRTCLPFDPPTTVDSMFIRACMINRLPMVQFFLKHGARVNFRDPRTGCTALHYASALRRKEIEEHLLAQKEIDAKLLTTEELTLRLPDGSPCGTPIPVGQNYRDFAAAYQARTAELLESCLVTTFLSTFAYPLPKVGNVVLAEEGLAVHDVYTYPGVRRDNVVNEIAIALLNQRSFERNLDHLLEAEAMISDDTLEAYRTARGAGNAVAERLLPTLEQAQKALREKISIWVVAETGLTAHFTTPHIRDIALSYVVYFKFRPVRSTYQQAEAAAS